MSNTTSFSSTFLRGDAALLIGGSIDASKVDEVAFNAWWTNEHLPERLAIPGFLRTRRYFALDTSAVPARSRYLVCYETSTLETLRSQPYLEALNNPTQETVKWMPVLSTMDRSGCRVRFSLLRKEFDVLRDSKSPRGAPGLGATAVLISFRCPPKEEDRQALHARMASAWWTELQMYPSTLAMHLLEHNHPATNAGAATACYDDAHLELAESASERWNLLIEFSEPLRARFGAVGAVQAEVTRRLQEDEGLSDVQAQAYQLIVSMSA